MVGYNCTQKVLNNTLYCIVKILSENNIKNWFVAYGTLLGIIREDSCIDGDDDVDIVIESIHYDTLKTSLEKCGFEFDYGHGIGDSKKILKTKQRKDYASVDFYFSSVDENGTFNDEWNIVVWTNCYDHSKKLIEYSWKDVELKLPFNSETKLAKRYGDDWRTPKQSKGNITPQL
jgi:hypothetical protein